MRENQEEARRILSELVIRNPQNRKASRILADSFFDSGMLQAAFKQYQELLEMERYDFEVFAIFIDICFRIGRTEILEEKFGNLDLSQATTLPGYHFCRGLYYKYEQFI
jgi:tetratricopeptide (TPR) repeat protein